MHSGDCRTGGVRVMGELLYPSRDRGQNKLTPPLSKWRAKTFQPPLHLTVKRSNEYIYIYIIYTILFNFLCTFKSVSSLKSK